MELAIDTSTNAASVALSEKGQITAEIAWQAGQNHTVELIPTILHLLDERKANIHEIEAVVVAKGPGSFNGLRVGLATAKGFSLALGIPLASIGTLEAIAFAYADQGLPICSILKAGKEEIATAIFQRQNTEWTKLISEHVTTIDHVCSSIDIQTVFCGEISPEQLKQLTQTLSEKALIPEIIAPPRAGCIAKLGWCRIKAGDFDDLSTLQPMYLKRPSITKPKRRKHDALSYMRP